MLEPYFQLFLKFPSAFLPDIFLLLAAGMGLATVRYANPLIGLLLWLVVLTLLLEGIAIHYAAYGINNNFIVNLTSLVEMGCLTGLFYFEIRTKKIRYSILVLFFTYLIVFVVYFDWIHISDYTLGIQRLIMIVFVIFHFHYLLTRMQIHNLLTYAPFWLSVGVILNASGTLFIFLFVDKTLGGDFPWYIMLARIFSCLFYLTVSICFWFHRRQVLSANCLVR